MHGAIPPLPQYAFMALCLVKHRDFTFNLRILRNVFQTVKVRLSQCLTKHHAMKAYRGVVVLLHAFLPSALDGGEWPAPLPGKEPLVSTG
jgi:hypothetical protein